MVTLCSLFGRGVCGMGVLSPRYYRTSLAFGQKKKLPQLLSFSVHQTAKPKEYQGRRNGGTD